MGSKVRNIRKAALFPRVLAGLLDTVLTVFAAGGLYVAGGAISRNVPYIHGYHESFTEKMEASGLVTFDDTNDGYQLKTESSYADYEALVYSFYSGFYSAEKEDGVTRDVYWFNVHVMGQEDVRALYRTGAVSSYVSTYGAELYTYRLDAGGSPLYDEFAIPSCCGNDLSYMDTITKAENDRLLAYFYKTDDEREELDSSDSWRNYVLYYCLSDLTGLSSVNTLYEKYYLYSVTLPLLSAIFLSMIVFLLVVPLVMKNGETLGKKITFTAVVNKLGYQVEKKQILFRSGFPILLLLFVILFAGINLVTIIGAGLVSVASFLLMIFTRDHTALHDLAAGTLVIDRKNSVWFRNAEEEAKAEKEVEEVTTAVNETEKPS